MTEELPWKSLLTSELHWKSLPVLLEEGVICARPVSTAALYVPPRVLRDGNETLLLLLHTALYKYCLVISVLC